MNFSMSKTLIFLLLGVMFGSVVSDSTDSDFFPYHVSLFHGFNYICDGALVSSYQVVVPAFCVYYARSTPNNFLVDFEFNGRDIDLNRRIVISSIVIHEKFVISSYDNDIAVLTMSESAPYGAAPIALASSQPSASQWAWMTGWGWLAFNGAFEQDQLLGHPLQIMTQSNCLSSLASTNPVSLKLNNMMICAINPTSDPNCFADKGSPLAMNNELIGLLSWGSLACQDGTTPAIFSNIYALSSWINAQLTSQSNVPNSANNVPNYANSANNVPNYVNTVPAIITTGVDSTDTTSQIINSNIINQQNNPVIVD